MQPMGTLGIWAAQSNWSSSCMLCRHICPWSELYSFRHQRKSPCYTPFKAGCSIAFSETCEQRTVSKVHLSRPLLDEMLLK